MPDRQTILIVEDDEAVAGMTVEHLQATVDAKVVRTAGAAETIRLVTDCSPDLMLVDLLLPDGNGLDLIRTIRARDEYPVLIMTGQPTLGRAVEEGLQNVAKRLPPSLHARGGRRIDVSRPVVAVFE